MKKTGTFLLVLTLVFSIFPLFISQAKAQTEPTISLTPSQITATQLNQIITVNVTISNVQNLWVWDAEITWDPTYLNMTSLPTEGNFMTQAGSTLFLPVSLKSGLEPDISDTMLETYGVNGSGVLATLQFQVIGNAVGTPITIEDITLTAPPSASSSSSATSGNGPPITPTSDYATATITLSYGGSPIANAGPNQVVPKYSTVIFNASNSISSGENPTYTWSFTDGTPKTLYGMIANYTFNTPGTYILTLVLQDSLGSSNSTVTITVENEASLVAQIVAEGLTPNNEGTITAVTGQTITFNGTESSESGGTVVGYLWDMGDGTGKGTNPTITYAYKIPGKFNITLTVFDAQNNTASTILPIDINEASSSTPVPSSSSTPVPSSSSTPVPSSSSTPVPSSSSTPVPTSGSASSGTNQQPFSLPPLILAILVSVTVAVLGGSTFWLRKNT
jgi:hypothetical protein